MMHTTRRARGILTAAAAFGAVAMLAGCGTQGGGSAAPTPEATELGQMEGTVSLLAWPGYVEDGSNDPAVDWVSGFEDKTGCMVTAKTYGTSDEAVNLMKTGDYDVVAASGDATLRLIASGDVAPVNTDLIPSYAGVFDFLKDKEIAKFKLPERVEMIDTFPVTKVGKVDKQVLRTMIAEKLAREQGTGPAASAQN